MSVYSMNRKDTVFVLKQAFAKMLAAKDLVWDMRASSKGRTAQYEFMANWSSPHQKISVTTKRRKR